LFTKRLEWSRFVIVLNGGCDGELKGRYAVYPAVVSKLRSYFEICREKGRTLLSDSIWFGVGARNVWSRVRKEEGLHA